MLEMNKIYNIDCRDMLRQIEGSCIDLVLTDMPYGITSCNWDKVPRLELLWKEFKRVGKKNCVYAFTAAQPFTTDLINSNRKWFKYEWIWDKHIPRGFQVAKYRPMMKHENVVIFCENKTKYNPQMILRDKPVTVKNYSKKTKVSSEDIGKYNDGRKFTYAYKSPDSIITGCWEANRGKLHPTQKPVTLMEYLIKTYSDKENLVCDPFMGGGTTAIACIRTGRNFIGSELEEKYYNISEQRISNEFKKRSLTIF